VRRIATDLDNLMDLADESDVRMVDWKSGPEAVLEQVDAALAEYGLEVVIIDAGSTDGLFSIERRMVVTPTGATT